MFPSRSPDPVPPQGAKALGNLAPELLNPYPDQSLGPVRRGLRRAVGRPGIVAVGRLELAVPEPAFVPAVGELIPEQGQ